MKDLLRDPDTLMEFEDRAFPEPMSGCWIWVGEWVTRGYGRFKGDKAYHFSYRKWKGEIPYGMVIDHLCRNTSCVNPDHLEAVTSKENTLRGIGPTAQNAVKTHCHRGHEFTPENTRIRVRGTDVRRECRQCQAMFRRQHLERARAALHPTSETTEVGNGH